MRYRILFLCPIKSSLDILLIFGWEENAREGSKEMWLSASGDRQFLWQILFLRRKFVKQGNKRFVISVYTYQKV